MAKMRCFLCGREGTRGFHEVRWGKHKGEMRCTASAACMGRISTGFKKGY